MEEAGQERKRQGQHPALHRPRVRRQRALPHRSPEGDDNPGEQGRGQEAPRPCPLGRPRRGSHLRPQLHHPARGVPGGLCGRGLPDCFRRRPHVHDDGPLQRGLEHGGARLEGPRPGRGPHVRQRDQGDRDLPLRSSRHPGPGHARVRHCRGRQARRHDRGRRQRHLLQLPRRPRPGDDPRIRDPQGRRPAL